MLISRHSVMPGARASLMVDLALGFAAMMLAASTLRSRFALLADSVPELPLVLFGAVVFTTTMAMMYAVVGLYRPKPISWFASALRTLVALVVGGSMGAQQTYEWAVRYPAMVKRAAPIAGSAGRYMSMAKGPIADRRPRMTAARRKEVCMPGRLSEMCRPGFERIRG